MLCNVNSQYIIDDIARSCYHMYMFTFRLKPFCEANGITIAELSRETKQTVTLVRRYWYGKTSTYDRDAVYALAMYCVEQGATIDELFTVVQD